MNLGDSSVAGSTYLVVGRCLGVVALKTSLRNTVCNSFEIGFPIGLRFYQVS